MIFILGMNSTSYMTFLGTHCGLVGRLADGMAGVLAAVVVPQPVVLVELVGEEQAVAAPVRPVRQPARVVEGAPVCASYRVRRLKCRTLQKSLSAKVRQAKSQYF